MTRNYKSLSTALTSRGMLLHFKENELIARCGHDIMKKFSEQYSHARYYIYCKLIFSIDTWYMIQCKLFEINVCHYTCSFHTCVLGGLTRRFQPVHQQKDLVGAMLLRSIRTNSSQVFSQGLDSILNFVVTLALPRYIATSFVSADAGSRSAHDVARTKGYAW